MTMRREQSYPPPKVNGAAPAPAVGATEGVAGIENPNPVLAGTDAVVPAILAVIQCANIKIFKSGIRERCGDNVRGISRD